MRIYLATSTKIDLLLVKKFTMLAEKFNIWIFFSNSQQKYCPNVLAKKPIIELTEYKSLSYRIMNNISIVKFDTF